jgi:hypothetical protein
MAPRKHRGRTMEDVIAMSEESRELQSQSSHSEQGQSSLNSSMYLEVIII